MTSFKNGDFLLQRCISFTDAVGSTAGGMCSSGLPACLPAAEPDDDACKPRLTTGLPAHPNSPRHTPDTLLLSRWNLDILLLLPRCLSQKGHVCEATDAHLCNTYWQPLPCLEKGDAVLVSSISNTSRLYHGFSPSALFENRGWLSARLRPAAADFWWSSEEHAVKSHSGPIDQRQAHRERTDYLPFRINRLSALC